MAFASGNVLYYVERVITTGRTQPGGNAIHRTVHSMELESEILLIRCSIGYCVAVTQEAIHVISTEVHTSWSVPKNGYEIVDATVFGWTRIFMVTSDRELLSLGINDHQLRLISPDDIEIISVSASRSGVCVLSSDMEIFAITDQNIDRSRRLVPVTSGLDHLTGQFRLESNSYVWNEEMVYGVRSGELVVSAEQLGSNIVSCVLVSNSSPFLLTEDGDVRSAYYPRNVIASGYSKICTLATDTDRMVLLGVNYAGGVEVIRGLPIEGLPTNVTLVSGELYIPNYRRIKSAVE